MTHVLFAILGPTMGQLFTGSEPQNPDEQTHEQESGESTRRDMAEEFAEWGNS